MRKIDTANNHWSIMNIENKEFEDCFIARSTTPDISGRFLSDKFVNLLLKVRIRTGDDCITCYLIEGVLYLSIDNVLAFFQVSATDEMNCNINRAIHLIEIIQYFGAMVTELNRTH